MQQHVAEEPPADGADGDDWNPQDGGEGIEDGEDLEEGEDPEEDEEAEEGEDQEQ